MVRRTESSSVIEKVLDESMAAIALVSRFTHPNPWVVA